MMLALSEPAAAVGLAVTPGLPLPWQAQDSCGHKQDDPPAALAETRRLADLLDKGSL